MPRYLLSQGAARDALTEEGETATDLADPEDFHMLAVLRNTQVAAIYRCKSVAICGEIFV